MTERNSIRVAQFVNNLNLSDGGPARNAFELNLALNRNGAHVQLISLSGDFTVVESHLAEAKALEEPPPVQLGRSRRPSNISATGILRELRLADAVIVHGYYLPWVPAIVALGRLFGLPVALMPHGVLGSHQRQFSRGKKRVFEVLAGWWVRRLVSVVVTASETEREELRAVYAGRTVVVGVGTQIPPRPDTHPPHRPIRLLTMSRLAPKKRIDLCIAAAGELDRRGVDVVLQIAGQGEESVRADLEGLVRRLGLEALVEFRGLLAGGAKDAALAWADVFLLTSEDENFGIGVAEAAAHGVPVVSSFAVAAAVELSDASRELIDEPSAGAVADAVEQIINGDYLGRQESARADAERLFDWDQVAERWLSALARRTT